MNKLVLYGAFDRYNYGDNLMPILFELFIKKYVPEFLTDYQIVYSSISASNLERYGCKKSESITSVVNDMPAGSSILVVGGEVLSASTSTLFLHMQNNNFEHYVLKRVKRYLSVVFNLYAKMRYGIAWEFPYIPDTDKLPANVKVLYNTVGGGINHLKPNELLDVKKRLGLASYISVRDERTLNELDSVDSQRKISLAPDSAYLMSDLIDDKFLSEHISIADKLLPNEYIVFQAAPNKIDSDLSTLVEQLKKVAIEKNTTIVLLPIGYASGHDDLLLLIKIQKLLPEHTLLVNDLSIWDIMYVIKESDAFFGTSLHGVITAMTFNVPHFGLNPKIAKLDTCLAKWSVPPYNKCYHAHELSELPSRITTQSIDALTTQTEKNKLLVKENNLNILDAIKG